jgi:Undecaprenyl-phosphate galactose phosphotransferase WbaP
MLAAMLCFGAGFFIVNAWDMSAINFSSFVTYWPYIPIFIIFFQVMQLYPGVSLAPAEELRRFTYASLLAHGSIIVSRSIEDMEFGAISIAFIISFVCSPVILLFFRGRMHRFLRRAHLSGIPAVIYGAGSMGRIVVDHLIHGKATGYVPVLILDDDPAAGDGYRGVPIIHDTSLGPKLVRRFNIKMAIVAMPGLSQEELAHILNYSVSAFRYNVLIPDFFSSANIWMSIRDFDGVLGLATIHKLKMPWNLFFKRFIDILFVILMTLILSPIFLLIAAAIKLTSPGPVLYGHERIGRNGKPFKAWKFRSMVIDADERLAALLDADPALRAEWELSHKLKNDPRVTGIGRLLRKTSFDEFPQFINILLGQMSLVGPRPVVREETEKYGEAFARIFSVRPGLTGLWQVSGRSDTDYAERVAYDSYYLQSWSVWLDLWVLYKTPVQIIAGKGAY